MSEIRQASSSKKAASKAKVLTQLKGLKLKPLRGAAAAEFHKRAWKLTQELELKVGTLRPTFYTFDGGEEFVTGLGLKLIRPGGHDVAMAPFTYDGEEMALVSVKQRPLELWSTEEDEALAKSAFAKLQTLWKRFSKTLPKPAR